MISVCVCFACVHPKPIGLWGLWPHMLPTPLQTSPLSPALCPHYLSARGEPASRHQTPGLSWQKWALYISQWLITVGEFSVNYDRGTSKRCLITILWPTCHSWGILWYLAPTVADEAVAVHWWLTHVCEIVPFYPAGLGPSFRPS